MKWGCKIAGIALLAFLLFLTCIGPGLLLAPITILFGWISAGNRLYKAWHPGAGTLAWAVVAIVLIAGTHVFLRWIYRSVNAGPPDTPQKQWRWRWTLSGYAALFCLVVAVTSMILTTHQVYWIAKGHDPLFADPFNGKWRMHAHANELKLQAEQGQWNITKARAAFFDGAQAKRSQVAAEEIQPVWIAGTNDTLRAIILIPRRPLIREKANFFVIEPEKDVRMCKLSELPQVLATFGAGDTFSGASPAGGLLP